jgi:hypothetical protein
MSDIPDRLARALERSYRLEREIGAGGMATVYLGYDVRHDRPVAVKVLRPELAAVLGADRFLQEIRVTAKLQHPHILPLFDSGSADGFLYYVMPYAAGGSLKNRLAEEGQLSVGEAVDVTVAAARALDYAHRQGVVHRDIKPGNIFLHEGQPVVADFGIALALHEAGGTRLTETGLTMGTPEYMSPEQGSGERDPGPRTDIYALGCVLYEMLSGHPPHTGRSSRVILAKILTETPVPVERERGTVPAHVSHAVSTALQRVPADRYASAGQFAEALSGGLELSGERQSVQRSRAAAVTIVALVATLAAAAGGAAVWLLRSPPTSRAQPVVRIPVTLADDQALLVSESLPLAMSRDGSRFVYVGSAPDVGPAARRLYLRRLEDLDAAPIPGTEGASAPFLSPDGAWVGFFVGRELRKAPLGGGPTVTLADSARTFIPSAAWLEDGTIVYPVSFGGLARLPDEGGPARVILEDSTVAVLGLSSLPDARGVLFVQCLMEGCPDGLDVVALDLRSGGRTTLVQNAATMPAFVPALPLYATSGHLLFGRGDGTLAAAGFDPDALALTSEPVPVLEGLLDPGTLDLAANGTLLYVVGSSGGSRRVEILDTAGAASPVAGSVRTYAFPRFARDDGRIAVEIHDASGGHVWVDDLASETLSKVTSGSHESTPVWAPDGAHLAYASPREAGSSVFVTPVDTIGAHREIYHAAEGLTPVTEWTPDGRIIFTRTPGPGGGEDVFLVAAEGGEAPTPLLSTPANESAARLSPDGRWLVYQSDQSGTTEVYVTSFPEAVGRWQISSGGGWGPVWRGSEIFYREGDSIRAATVTVGARVSVTARRTLFDDSRYRGIGATFDVAHDGPRLLMLRNVERPASLVVVVNWFEELRARLGG